MTNCKSAIVLIKNLWEEYGEIASNVGCSAIGVGAAAASMNPLAAVQTRTACLEAKDKIETVTRAMIEKFHSIVGRTSAMTIGPRLLPLGSWQRGQVLGTAGRMFVTAVPMTEDSVRLRLRERSGRGKVGIAVCAIDQDGDEDQLADITWNENRRERRDDSQRTTRTFRGVEGKWIVVHIDGKSVAKRFRYSLCLDD